MEFPHGKRVRDFFEQEAKSIFEKFRIIETLLPSSTTKGSAHPVEEGRFIEALIRDFLNKHLPTNLKAVSGFILRPSTKTGNDNLERVYNSDDCHSRQMDIIVYDFSAYPVYEKFEEFVIVPPEGVIALISVKKTLYRSAINSELLALREAVELCSTSEGRRRLPFTAIFSFTSEHGLQKHGAQACYDIARSVHEGDQFDRIITEITVFNDFLLFKFREKDSDRLGYAKFVNIDCREKRHIPLQRLLNSILSVHYDLTRGSAHQRPGFVSFDKGTFGSAPVVGYVKLA